VAFEQAFMFFYSLREKTRAHRRLVDNVPLAVKKRRLAEVIDTFRHFSRLRTQQEVGLLQVLGARVIHFQNGLVDSALFRRLCLSMV
jgi:tRNA A37 methylthiotransferase MiaB